MGPSAVRRWSPDHDAYRAYGIGHWNIERELPDAALEYWTHSQEVGKDFQTAFRARLLTTAARSS